MEPHASPESKTTDSPQPYRLNTLVLVDADNLLLGSSQGAASAHAFAEASSKRIEGLLGGPPRAKIAFLNPASHPDGLEAFSQAGFITRATPSLTSGGRTSSADAVMMIEGLQWVFERRPDRVAVVSADTDFVPLVNAIKSLGIEVMVLTPSAQVPRALAAAASSARPLWPSNGSTQRRATRPSAGCAPRTRLRQQRAPRPISVPVRASGQAPPGVYRALVQPLQRQGIACPAIDEDRLQRVLELADVALGARDPFLDLQRLTKSESLGLRPAEIGFVLRAISEGGRRCNKRHNGGTGTVRDAFTAGLEGVAEATELPAGGSAAVHEWVGSPPPASSLSDQSRRGSNRPKEDAMR